MRYLMFSLTALFLLACGDTDNPVVPTAPAGKATVDLSAEECAAAESLPDGFLEQALEVNADLDAELLLSTWQAHGCADWALWGLIWLESLDADLTFDIEVHTPPELITDFQHENDSEGNPIPRISEVRIPPLVLGELDQELWDTGSPTLRKAIQDQWTGLHLYEAGALSTVSVSGSNETRTITRKDKDNNTFTTTHHYAVFTFTRIGGHLDENLVVTFSLRHKDSSNTTIFSGSVTSGFSPNSETFTYEVEFTGSGGEVTVSITGGQFLYAAGESVTVSR